MSECPLVVVVAGIITILFSIVATVNALLLADHVRRQINEEIRELKEEKEK